MFVRLKMALSHAFGQDHLALPLSTPLSSRRSMVWCPSHPDWSLVSEPSVRTMRAYGLLLFWKRSLISGSVLPAGHSWQRFFWQENCCKPPPDVYHLAKRQPQYAPRTWLCHGSDLRLFRQWTEFHQLRSCMGSFLRRETCAELC